MHSLKKLKTAALYAFGVAMVVLLAIVLTPQKAPAADLQGMTSKAEAEAASPATHWTGCGVGIGASYTMGLVMPTGSTAGIGSDGEQITPSLRCDLRVDNLVFGLSASYGFVYGNMHSLAPNVGINSNIEVDGRAGLLISPNTLLYLHGGWTQLGLTGMTLNSVNGWEGGAGVEMKLPTRLPLFADAKYTFSSYNIDKLTGTTGIAADTSTFGLHLIYKFYQGSN